MRYFILAVSYLVVAVVALFVGVQLSPYNDLPMVQPVEYRSVPIQDAPFAFTDGDTHPQLEHIRVEDVRLEDIDRQPTIFRKLHFAYQLAAASDIPALESYLDRLLGEKDNFLSYNIASVFLERLLELDIMHAIHYVESADIPKDQMNRFISDMVASWVRHDPEAAIQYIQNTTSQELKRMFSYRILNDPTLADTELLSGLLQDMGEIGEQVLMSREQSQRSPEEAFEEALLMKGMDRDRQRNLMNAAVRWFMADPDAVLARLADIDNPMEKQMLMQMIVSMRGRDDPLAALELVRLYAPDDINLERQALSGFLGNNIEEALPYVEAFVKRTGDEHIYSQLAQNWARQDPQAAIAYVDNIPTQHRQSYMRSVAQGYISRHPEEGMRWAMGLENRQIQEHALNILPSVNMDLAEAWLKRLEDQRLSTALLSNIASTKAQSNPEQAYQWLADHKNRQGYQEAVYNVISQWARTDPVSAADILEQYQEDSNFAGLFSSLAQQWANRNPEEAISWLDSLPKGDNRSSAATALIHQIARHDQDMAIDLLDEVPERESSSLRFQLANQWLRQTPDELEDIIDKLDLTPEQARQLREEYEHQTATNSVIYNGVPAAISTGTFIYRGN